MSRARTLRAERLLAAERRRLAERERELADARRELEAREGALAFAASEERAAETRWLEVSSVEELEQASSFRCALAARVVQAREGVARAASVVREKEAAAIAVRVAERRFEVLIEGFTAVAAAHARKLERKAADEHAARRAGATNERRDDPNDG